MGSDFLPLTRPDRDSKWEEESTERYFSSFLKGVCSGLVCLQGSNVLQELPVNQWPVHMQASCCGSAITIVFPNRTRSDRATITPEEGLPGAVM